MTTALGIITRALRLVGAYGTSENVEAAEANDGLTALNSMLDEWANESLMIYARTLNSIALTGGLATYTVGPTGTTVSARPVSIDAGTYLTYSGVDYPLSLVTLDQYNEVPVKTLQGIPTALLHRGTFPDATLTLYPVPQSGMTLNLWSIKPLTTFAALTDVVSLPPGYENAVVFNLAEYLAPEFGASIPLSVHVKAMAAKRKLKRTNYETAILEIPASVPRGFNILTGSWW